MFIHYLYKISHAYRQFCFTKYQSQQMYNVHMVVGMNLCNENVAFEDAKKFKRSKESKKATLRITIRNENKKHFVIS